MWPMWNAFETTHVFHLISFIVFLLFPLSVSVFKVTIFQKCGMILVGEILWKLLKKKKAYINIQRYVSLTSGENLIACIQIGLNFLQYQLLKIHFCFTVGFFEEEKKNPCYSHYRWRHQHHNHRERSHFIAILFTKVVVFFSWSIAFDYFFLSENTWSTVSVCWLSLYLQKCLGLWVCIYAERDIESLFSGCIINWNMWSLYTPKADRLVVKCYLFYFRWEYYHLSLLTLILTVILSPPSNSTSVHEEQCIISTELLLE